MGIILVDVSTPEMLLYVINISFSNKKKLFCVLRVHTRIRNLSNFKNCCPFKIMKKKNSFCNNVSCKYVIHI